MIQRRQDGTVNFYMKWDHYKRGFGSAAGEYWLGMAAGSGASGPPPQSRHPNRLRLCAPPPPSPPGLETMHLLTRAKSYQLRVDMEDFGGQSVFAQYASFAVGPEAEGYQLSLGSFVGGAAGAPAAGSRPPTHTWQT